jgi:hypothetical protein
MKSLPNIFFIPFIQFLLLLALLSSEASASDISAKDLIDNCQELVAIYDRRGERQLFAGISTSVAEAMRAGICRGMIEEYINHVNCSNGWYAMANGISSSPIGLDVERILGRACDE